MYIKTIICFNSYKTVYAFVKWYLFTSALGQIAVASLYHIKWYYSTLHDMFYHDACITSPALLKGYLF